MKRWRLVCGLWLLFTGCIFSVVWGARLMQGARHQLVSSGFSDDNMELFLVDADRGLSINLTHSAGDDSFPAWSPDGQRLVVYSERHGRTDIYLRDLEGRDVTRLAESGGAGAVPAWSGDGQWIAYAAMHQPNAGLYIVRPDGTDIHRLTDYPVVTIMWSPDSQQIAFVGNCDGNCDIYVVNIGSLNVRQLTHNGLIDAYPIWSPDSRQLAFVSNRSMSFELYVIDVDCDETRLGGCTTERLTMNRAADSFPSWSPDGKHIAFSSDRNQNYEIYTVEADCFRHPQGCNEQVTAITQRSGTNIMPLWSPDGQQIAFLSADHGGHYDVYVVDLSDRSVHLVMNRLPNAGTVSWRPDNHS